MSAVATPAIPAAPPARPVFSVEAGQRLLLEDIDWRAYETIGEALLNRSNIYMTYDRRRLEIMTLSQEHERLKCLIGSLIAVLAEETNVRVEAFGSTTYKRDVLERGLEPDQCYYHRNYHRVRGLRRIDLARDPPPDFAVEIDVAHSSLDRMAIYAGLGVPEVWRLKGDIIFVYLLNAEGRYEPADRSPTFPTIPVTELVPFLQIGFTEDTISMIRTVRAWVRNLPPRP